MLSRNLKRKRHYPAAVMRAVFLRDGKQCSYVSLDGRRCNARRCLELDHIEPVAVGGADTIENLRLRCRAHNQRSARLYFGKERVEAAVRNSRRRRVTTDGINLESAAVQEPTASDAEATNEVWSHHAATSPLR